jgi:hypothetical protein
MDTPTKEYMLAAALKLSPDERLWLVERLVSSVRQAEPEQRRAEDPDDTHVVHSQTGEWESANVEESFEWLQELGQKKTDILKPK